MNGKRSSQGITIPLKIGKSGAARPGMSGGVSGYRF